MPDGESPAVQPPEALAVCPICSLAVPPAVYESHLRQVHRLYAYRGVRRLLADTVDAMLEDLLATPPFAVAWPALVRLAHEEKGPEAGPFLARTLADALARRPAGALDRLLPALAALVAPGNVPLLAALAKERAPAARRFLLAGVASLGKSLDPALLGPLRTVLLDRSLPGEEQVQALAAVLPRTDDGLAADLLGKLVAGLGKSRAVDRLRQVERLAGPRAPLTALCERLQEKVRMSCPRCGVQHRRPAMLTHLWDAHRLVLDGLRVRDPWHVIEEWLEAAKEQRAASSSPVQGVGSADRLLERCRVAAAKIDPEGGADRLQRLAAAHGVADAETRRGLLAEAREQQAACCPWCFALVPAPREGPPPAVNFRPGRLSGGGYSVELGEGELRTWLAVHTPDGVVYEGPDPDRPLSARGAALVASGPLVLAALVVALVWPSVVGQPVKPVLALLVLAVLARAGVRFAARLRGDPGRRLLGHTWRMLVPRLHEGGFRPADAAFLAGLARLYARRGKAGVAPDELARAIRLTEPAVQRGEAPPGWLAALCRLEIERSAELGRDPVPAVVQWLARCFTGRLPLAFAQQLLEDWATAWWTPGNLARLRVLLCDRAFEAGFEVGTLLDAGRNAPALGAVLKTDRPLPLAALRLVWSLRATRPWDRLGAVLTAFELAEYAGRADDLVERQDVLLWHEDPGCLVVAEEGDGPMAPARVRLTLEGVWLQDVLFVGPPREVEVRLKSVGSLMTLGRQVFRSPIDLEPLGRRLERWFRYAFHEFLPQVERVLSWQPPDRAALLRAWGAAPCPACGRHLLPRPGEVGLALDEPSPAAGRARADESSVV